ncbi:MAG: alpha/beta hydrolase [Caldilineaceae bacterium]
MQNHSSIHLTVQSQTLISQDGTTINYQTRGSGPAVILIPGALSVAANYAALANALAERFTVHVLERRGRGLSGRQSEQYSIRKECEDVASLQEKTQAAYLFGHSYGGLIALEVGRNCTALSKIAVYEPGVSINGSIPMSWIPTYQAQLAKKKFLDAFITFALATGPEGTEKTPPWLMKAILAFTLPGHERRQICDLLPANLLEHKEVGRLDNSYKNYQEIPAEVLLMYGGKSSSAIKHTTKLLAQVIPNAKVRAFTKLDHFGPDKKAPDEIAQALRDHFLE